MPLFQAQVSVAYPSSYVVYPVVILCQVFCQAWLPSLCIILTSLFVSAAWRLFILSAQSSNEFKCFPLHFMKYFKVTKAGGEEITMSAPWTFLNGSFLFSFVLPTKPLWILWFQSNFKFQTVELNSYSKWLLTDSSSRTIFYFAKVTCKAGTFSLWRAVSFICIEDTRGHPSWWLNQQGSSLPQSAPKLIRCITSHISLSSKLRSTLGYLRGYLYFPAGIFAQKEDSL